MYIKGIREKENHFSFKRKGPHMKATRIGNQRFTSASKAALHLAKTTNLNDTEIAKKVGIKPQTVHQAIRNDIVRNIPVGN